MCRVKLICHTPSLKTNRAGVGLGMLMSPDNLAKLALTLFLAISSEYRGGPAPACPLPAIERCPDIPSCPLVELGPSTAKLEEVHEVVTDRSQLSIGIAVGLCIGAVGVQLLHLCWPRHGDGALPCRRGQGRLERLHQ